MSILIKGMEMPTSCWPCPFFHTSLHHIGDDELLERYTCLRTGERTEEIFNGRMDNCPLVPIPPHGRLIDADALLKTNNPVGKTMVFGGQYVYTENEIQAAPTIIEAEEGE